MKDPLASLTASQLDSVSWGNSRRGTTFCRPRFPPASPRPPRKNIQLSMLHDKTDYPWTSSKTKPFLYVQCSKCFGILQDQSHSINKLIFLYSLQLKNPIKTLQWPFTRERLSQRGQDQKTPEAGLQQKWDRQGKRLLQLFYFSHWGGKGWPNSIGRSERLLLGLPSSVTDS